MTPALTNLAPGTKIAAMKNRTYRRWDVEQTNYPGADVDIAKGDIGVVLGKCPVKHDHSGCCAHVIQFPDGITNIVVSGDFFEIHHPRADPMPLKPRRRLQLA